MTTIQRPIPQGPIPINDPEATQAAGIAYPATENGWRWTYRQRHQRGLSHCFVRVGRRILVDPRAYLDALAAQRQGKAMPAPASAAIPARRTARRAGGEQ